MALSDSDFTAMFTRFREAHPLPILDGVSAAQNGERFNFVQYWDTEPDEQVSILLRENERCAEKFGLRWWFFDRLSARQFIADVIGARGVTAFDKCLHPAQESDLFRYIFLWVKGGFWLDADLVLCRSPVPMMVLNKPIFFQRTNLHSNLTNWFLITPPRHSLYETLIEKCLANFENKTFFNAHAASGDIPAISGFHVMRSAVAATIDSNENAQSEPPLYIIDETIHDRYVQLPHRFLGEQLAYKKTTKAWQVWSGLWPGNK